MATVEIYPSEKGTGSNGNEVAFDVIKSFWSGAFPSNCLVSYRG